MPTNSPDYSKWFTKQTAAGAIGVSVKTIENLGNQKKIASELWRNPAGGPLLRVYSPDDVQRLADARRNAGSPRFTQPLPDNGAPAPLTTGLAIPATTTQPLGSSILETLLLEIAGKQAGDIAKHIETVKLCLTIPEAAEFAGLSETFVRRACIDGTLAAFRDGRVWKVRRSALVALYGTPQP